MRGSDTAGTGSGAGAFANNKPARTSDSHLVSPEQRRASHSETVRKGGADGLLYYQNGGRRRFDEGRFPLSQARRRATLSNSTRPFTAEESCNHPSQPGTGGRRSSTPAAGPFARRSVGDGTRSGHSDAAPTGRRRSFKYAYEFSSLAGKSVSKPRIKTTPQLPQNLPNRAAGTRRQSTPGGYATRLPNVSGQPQPKNSAFLKLVTKTSAQIAGKPGTNAKYSDNTLQRQRSAVNCATSGLVVKIPGDHQVAHDGPMSVESTSQLTPRSSSLWAGESTDGHASNSPDSMERSAGDEARQHWATLKYKFVDTLDDLPVPPEFVYFQRGTKKFRYRSLVQLRQGFDAMCPNADGHVSYDMISAADHILNAVTTRDVNKMKLKLAHRAVSCAGRIDQHEEDGRDKRLALNVFNFVDLLRFNFFSCDYEEILEMANLVAPSRLAFDKMTRRQIARASKLFKDIDSNCAGKLTYDQLEDGLIRHYPRENVHKLIKSMNSKVLDKLYLGGTIIMEEFVIFYAEALIGKHGALHTSGTNASYDELPCSNVTDPADIFHKYIASNEEMRRTEAANMECAVSELRQRIRY